MSVGWLINDCLTCIPGTRTFWHDLLDWFPDLQDKTNGYTPYSTLPDIIENQANEKEPNYIIRNGTYFRPLKMKTAKTVSLIQDVKGGDIFDLQLATIKDSERVVFNSYYILDKFRAHNLHRNLHIIPLGVDFNFFKPSEEIHSDILPNSVLYIGSSDNYPKGFNIMLDIINKMSDTNFCLIMKDNWKVPEHLTHRVRVYNRVNQQTVKTIINSCAVAVCTSYEETQHLAGIECGACNIPIVARAVGWYYDCRYEQAAWGAIADDNTFVEKINMLLNGPRPKPREYLEAKYSTDVCKKKWQALINGL